MTDTQAVLFGFDFRPLAPEERRLMWSLRARGGGASLCVFPCRKYARRLGARLRGRGFARFARRGARLSLELTPRGHAYLDRLMRAE